MEVMHNMLKSQNKALLEQARKTYGNKNQILVSAEECCELAKELLKYPRYETHEQAIEKTRNNVLDERADLEIVLNHIDAIYQFTPEEIEQACEKKLSRLSKWLETSNSMQYTTEFRDLTEKDCKDCFYYDHWDDPKREETCINCAKRG